MESMFCVEVKGGWTPCNNLPRRCRDVEWYWVNEPILQANLP